MKVLTIPGLYADKRQTPRPSIDIFPSVDEFEFVIHPGISRLHLSLHEPGLSAQHAKALCKAVG